jgi:hypothetical protein
MLPGTVTSRRISRGFPHPSSNGHSPGGCSLYVERKLNIDATHLPAQNLLELVSVNFMTLAPHRNTAVGARANVFEQLPRGSRRCHFLS